MALQSRQTALSGLWRNQTTGNRGGKGKCHYSAIFRSGDTGGKGWCHLYQFYILGLAGKAAGYPTELVLGEEGKVIVGIINREHETVSYRLEVRINGARNNELGPIVLEHDEKWEREISFVPEKAGENQKVEFFLYLNGEAEPYLEPLRVWVDVKK